LIQVLFCCCSPPELPFQCLTISKSISTVWSVEK
jgi:hypothetical protein